MWSLVSKFVVILLLHLHAVRSAGVTTESPISAFPGTSWTEELSVENETIIRINGGVDAKEPVPYQVSLQSYRSGKWRHFCGASILTNRFVATAAHCVDKGQLINSSLVAGTLNLQRGGYRYSLIKKYQHPNFTMSPTIVNDLAILEVSPSFKFDIPSTQFVNTIWPVSLPVGIKNTHIGDRRRVRVTGWGLTTPTKTSGLPNQLQSLEYETITNDECRRRGFRVTPNELCTLAVVAGKGTCQGDSGGPLVLSTGQKSPQLVGIVSYGTATCAQGRPDVYTRISKFVDWINTVIGAS